MSIEDQPTQQIRRPAPPAPMPGSLGPVRDHGDPADPADPPDSGSTEILSLDDLLSGPQAPTTEGPSRPVDSPRVEPVAETPTPAAETPTPVAPPPAAPRIGAVPVSAEPQRTGRAGGVLGDAASAWRGSLDRSRAWLTAGDNTVIVATAVIALLLLLAVALF
jgi:hypothetical protein